jgi:NTE family protein
VVELLANLAMDHLVDADQDVRDMVRTLVQGAGRLEILREVWRAREDLGEASKDLGLNPGMTFREGLSNVPRDEGINSARQLGQRMKAVPQSLRRRDGQVLAFGHDDFRLALVAADVSTETKAVFPKMAPLYWEDPDGVHPARFVRASASIPLFFRPLRVEGILRGEAARKNWKALANYEEDLRTEWVFGDSGTVSNFPGDLFHKPQEMPVAPLSVSSWEPPKGSVRGSRIPRSWRPRSSAGRAAAWTTTSSRGTPTIKPWSLT